MPACTTTYRFGKAPYDPIMPRPGLRRAAYWCEHISDCSGELAHSLTIHRLTLRECRRLKGPCQAPACHPRPPQLAKRRPAAFPPPALVGHRPQVSVQAKRRPQVDRPQVDLFPRPRKTARREQTRWKASRSWFRTSACTRI